MRMYLLGCVLSVLQVAGEQKSRTPHEEPEALFARAAKAHDLDEAGLILSSLLTDASALRSAFLASASLDQRSAYILYRGNWGSRAKVGWQDRQRWQRICNESISENPALIRPCLRAARHETYDERRHPRGAVTINSFSFFSSSTYGDDLVEIFVETLREESTHPAQGVRSPYNEKVVLVSAEQVEQNLLGIWQLLCGVCDRPDLIDKATTGNWRSRFGELDEWFKTHRPYVSWDDERSCLRIDKEAKGDGRPTARSARAIPELKPPWFQPG